MKERYPSVAPLLAGVLLLGGARAASAADPGGSLLGWVEDSRGAPVAGALVSLFAKGMRGGGLVTFSDEAGRFALPSLPAGSYTVRAVGQGLKPAAARQVTVLPNQESILALSLPSLGELSDKESAERRRELTWLVRHKSRSVLEQRGSQWLGEEQAETAAAGSPATSSASPPRAADLGGQVELVAATTTSGGYAASSDFGAQGSGALRFEGRLSGDARFTVGGVLAESEDTSWRMAAELVIGSEDDHELRAGAGYGTRLVRPLTGAEELAPDGRAVGALFIEDRAAFGESVIATAGLRQTYVGFVEDKNHLDPSLGFEVTPYENTRLRIAAEERTVVPGGDLLTLSTLATAPAILYAAMPSNLRAERIVRFEIGADRSFAGTLVGVRAWDESIEDQLVNAFAGRGSLRQLHIFNAGATNARGLAVDLSRGFGRAVRGSLAYSFGRVSHELPVAFVSGPSVASLPEGEFHDLVGRFEAGFDPTDTRLVAFYRVNFMSPDGEETAAAAGPLRTSRFDVQVSQGLPFLGDLTRADWELLVAVRNVFYEPAEAGALDELAVVAPPTRVLGGISVRF
ncbi:MAG TPA: TonB-dependent receptor [Vicinamibacteria bacterium]|nr:TonB-dependent receptor [Vicinamibacteria bacterium]